MPTGFVNDGIKQRFERQQHNGTMAVAHEVSQPVYQRQTTLEALSLVDEIAD